jgi:AraC family transcriptional regulator
MGFLGKTLRVRETTACRVTETVLAGEATFPTHEHRAPYVSFLLAGGYTEHRGAAERRCTSGAVLWHGPAEVHGDVVDAGGAHVLNLELTDPEAVSLAPPLARAATRSTTLGLALFRALAASERDLDERGCELWAAVDPDPDTAPRPAWLRRALELVHDELAEPLRLGDVARRVAVHPVHVARTFRRVLHTSVGDYLAEARVLRACELLRRSRAAIADVAAATGFADHAHLTRTFKRLTGMTPSAYRGWV